MLHDAQRLHPSRREGVQAHAFLLHTQSRDPLSPMIPADGKDPCTQNLVTSALSLQQLGTSGRRYGSLAGGIEIKPKH
jgi:hypothetical protein